jgi:hypothetical protein
MRKWKWLVENIPEDKGPVLYRYGILNLTPDWENVLLCSDVVGSNLGCISGLM